MTADVVVFSFDGTRLNVLLIKRGHEPYKDCWAFPGGFLDENETLEEAARRELKEETGLTPKFFNEVGSFSDLDRDPRGRTITVAFASVVRPNQIRAVAGDDAKEARWFDIHEMPRLAFDHEKIYRMALWKLRLAFINSPVAFLLLDDIFTPAGNAAALHARLLQGVRPPQLPKEVPVIGHPDPRGTERRGEKVAALPYPIPFQRSRLHAATGKDAAVLIKGKRQEGTG